MAVASNQSRAL